MTLTEFETIVQASTGRLTKICRSWLARMGLADHAEDCVSRAWMEFVQPAESPKYLTLTPDQLMMYATAGTRRRAGDVVRFIYGREDNRGDSHKGEIGLMQFRRDVQALALAKSPDPTELSEGIESALETLTDQQRIIVQAMMMEDEGLPNDPAGVAKLLGISRRTVYREIDKIRDRLGACLKPFAPRQWDSETLGQSANTDGALTSVSPSVSRLDGDTAVEIRDRVKRWRRSRDEQVHELDDEGQQFEHGRHPLS